MIRHSNASVCKTEALCEGVYGLPDPVDGGDDVVVDDGGDPALSWAGADDAYDGPGEVLSPDHERTSTVPRTGGLLAVTVAGTQLVLAGQTGPGLCLTLRPGQHWHSHRLQGAGVGRALLHPQPAPAYHGALGPGLNVQGRVRQTDRPDVCSWLHLKIMNYFPRS